MNLKTAKQNLEKYTKNNQKLTPTLTNDWKVKKDYYYAQGSKVVASSEILNLNIDISESGDFLNDYIFNGKLRIEDNLIMGTYAYTKNGFISEEEYFLSEDLVEQSKEYTPIKPSEFEEGFIYLSDEDNHYLYVGELRETYVIMNDESIEIDNDPIKEKKEKYFIQIDNEAYIENGKIEYKKNHWSYIIRNSKLKLIIIAGQASLKDLEIGKLNFRRNSKGNTLFIKKGNMNKTLIKGTYKWSDEFFKYKDDYYIETGTNLRHSDLENAIKIGDGRISTYSEKGYFKVKDINKLLNFNKDQISDLFEEDYYCFISGNEKLEIEKVYFY